MSDSMYIDPKGSDSAEVDLHIESIKEKFREKDKSNSAKTEIIKILERRVSAADNNALCLANHIINHRGCIYDAIETIDDLLLENVAANTRASLNHVRGLILTFPEGNLLARKVLAIEEGKQSACASRLHDYETKDEWLHNSETEDERVLKRKIQEQDIINRIEKRFELNMLSSNSSELAENFNSTSSSSTESAASVNSSASDDKGKNKDEKPQKEE